MPVTPSTFSMSTAAGSNQVVTVAEIKKHLEIGTSITAHDDQLAMFRTAAVEWWEQKTNCLLLSRTKTIKGDCFPRGRDQMYLGFYPVTAVSSVTYKNSTSDSNTLSSSDYVLSLDKLPPEIGLAADKNWPVTKTEADSVNINCTAGYGTSADVPEDIKICLLMMIAHWFENREAVNVGKSVAFVPLSVKAIVNNYKMGEAYLGVYDGN